ncbi:MAG TPA: undecaprenyl-diphosphate phosphatase [Fimbriimonadaceae bacterium]|nr:undecaprenyl-diphosphate phosphatase [Fimbriimonadaceae bacterium]
MDLIQAIVYGIVQGLTEFLPISSTAHLRIVPALAGWADPGAGFTAVIQLGTLLAVLIYFARDLSKAFMGWVRNIGNPRSADPDARMGWAIVVGTIPIVVLGVLAQKWIKGELRSLWVIAATLILMGLIMAVAERVGAKRRQVEDVQVKDGWIVGFWQALALIPGMSRSGSTISGALLDGFDRAAAARFSFLLSIPSILAAGLKELYDERKELMGSHLTPTLVATVVSFVVGYASIAFLMKFLQRHGILPFVLYRILLGVALIILLATGVLSPMSGMAQ